MKKKISPIVVLIILPIIALVIACDENPVRPLLLVAETGGDYNTIQRAIDHAVNGSIIKVAEGTYTEDVYINKQVTLQGNDGEEVIIKGTVQITVRNVNIEHLTVHPKSTHGLPGLSKSQLIGFYLDPMAQVSFNTIQVIGEESGSLNYRRGIKAAPGAQFSVTNSTFKNVKTAIFVNGEEDSPRSTLHARNNSFTNVWAGIGGTESSDVTITDNLFNSIATVNGYLGEGIGLGKGVQMFNTEGISIDSDALEEANTFNFETHKVQDYR